jgi:hypothetical protein
MLPNFLIIGAQKAGTTWLAKCLGEHPDVFIPEIKEIYYFDRHYDKGLAWYEAYFEPWSGEKAVGEGTVGYIRSTTSPGRIHDTLGDDVKLIASLRHPVERAYSAYRMHLSRGEIPYAMDFATFVREDVRTSLSQSTYTPQLERYLAHFARENLLVLIYEEIYRDTQNALDACARYLGVAPGFIPPSVRDRVNNSVDVSVMHNQVWGLRKAIKGLPPAIERPLARIGRRVFAHLPKKKRWEPLDPALKQELSQGFERDIEQLERLLDRDLDIWRTPIPVRA